MMPRSILVGTMLLFLLSCGDPCSNEIQAQSDSPDRLLNATWFVRDCGATTDFSTIVSVRSAGEPYERDKYWAFVAKGRQKLRLVWESSDHLTIECVGCEQRDIFKKLTIMNKVKISYRID